MLARYLQTSFSLLSSLNIISLLFALGAQGAACDGELASFLGQRLTLALTDIPAVIVALPLRDQPQIAVLLAGDREEGTVLQQMAKDNAVPAAFASLACAVATSKGTVDCSKATGIRLLLTEQGIACRDEVSGAIRSSLCILPAEVFSRFFLLASEALCATQLRQKTEKQWLPRMIIAGAYDYRQLLEAIQRVPCKNGQSNTEQIPEASTNQAERYAELGNLAALAADTRSAALLINDCIEHRKLDDLMQSPKASEEPDPKPKPAGK